MLYTHAKPLAEKLAALLSPGCTRLEIVGSVKRGDRQEVHDIEILCIPDEKRARPEFGQKIPKVHFYQVLDNLEATGVLHFVSGASRLRKYAIREAGTLNPFHLELYIVRPETWGIQNVIRTGPSLFSHAFVTQRNRVLFDEGTNRHYHGLLPEDLTYVRGETAITRGGAALFLPEESDALALIGYGWVEPKDRIRLVKPALVTAESG